MQIDAVRPRRNRSILSIPNSITSRLRAEMKIFPAVLLDSHDPSLCPSRKNVSTKKISFPIADLDVNVTDLPVNGGNTALHAVSGLPERRAILRRLLQCGADANARNSEGRTPLMVAAQWGNMLAAEVRY